MSLDLDAYFDRIHWREQPAADLATLRTLLLAHIRAIPFENLDVLLGRTIRLDLAGLQHKLVSARRGGYCYEHATLFGAVLDRLGFASTMHTARVTTPALKASKPRTHAFLSVALPQGVFIVDPGFGGLTPMVPVPLDGAHVSHNGEEYWLERDVDGDLVMTVRTPDKRVEAWVSSMTREFPIDVEMANHFTATHPSSPFTSRLMLRAFTPDGRVTVMNDDVTYWRGHEPAAGKLADRAALRALLASSFGIDLPEVELLRVPSIPAWA